MQTVRLASRLRFPGPITCARPSPTCLRPSQWKRGLLTKKYTVEHEAVVFDDTTGIGTVSITEYAQASLGDIVFVEIKEGGKVSQGDQLGAVESVKAASDIYAPVSGTVMEVNKQLSSEPGLVNKSPEDKGWLCRIKLSNPSELEALMTEEAYKATLET